MPFRPTLRLRGAANKTSFVQRGSFRVPLEAIVSCLGREGNYAI